MAKVRDLGPRPDNSEWGPGRTHGGTNPIGPPKVEDEDLHRRGDAPADAPGKEGVTIEPHIRAAYNDLDARLRARQAVGRDAGQSVRDALGSDREYAGHARRALLAGLTPAQIDAVMAAHNEAGEFAVGNDSVGAAAWAAVRALSASGTLGEPGGTPSSNPIDPSTGKPYIPTRLAAEAVRRVRAGIGIQGNGLTAADAAAGLAAELDAPAAYKGTDPETVLLVVANSLDPELDGRYAGWTPQAVVDVQSGQGAPSGGDR